MTVIADVLQSVRLSGAFLCRADFHAPWAVKTRGFDGAGLFHAVVEGGCTLEVEGERPRRLEAGAVALLPHGDGHVMTSEHGLDPVSMASLAVDDDGTMAAGGDGPRTVVVCGRVAFGEPGVHPLFAGLPRVLVLEPTAPGGASPAAQLARLIAAELDEGGPGTGTMVERLCEVVVLAVLRAFFAGEEARTLPPGWLRGLADPDLGRALSALHAAPAEEWTVDRLAHVAGLGRSSFFERFTERVGETPSRYLARWRMHLAAEALSRGQTVQEAADLAGYASQPAFSKAFKRVVGRSPSELRRRSPDQGDLASAVERAR